MKKSLILIAVSLVLVLFVISFASAGFGEWIRDLFGGGITGSAISFTEGDSFITSNSRGTVTCKDSNGAIELFEERVQVPGTIELEKIYRGKTTITLLKDKCVRGNRIEEYLCKNNGRVRSLDKQYCPEGTTCDEELGACVGSDDVQLSPPSVVKKGTSDAEIKGSGVTASKIKVLSLSGEGNAFACLDSEGNLFRSDVPCR